MSDLLNRYVSVMSRIYPDITSAPKLLERARAVQRVVRGAFLDSVAAETGLPKRHLGIWAQAVQGEGLYEWLGKQEPKPEKIQRSREGIVQMFLGALAEEHFEALALGILGPQGFGIDDERLGRTDTDYRLLDPTGRPVCRLNIKFHGTLFRESAEYVGLEPSDCFALATYKIHGALRRQDQERLPYVFLITSVPNLPRAAVEQSIESDFAWLASISGRSTEEAIVHALLAEPWASPVRSEVRQSEFRVISARRANLLLTEKLFDRVHALRLRGFTRTFRGAEINMHLSFSSEMLPFDDFLKVLAERGPMELTVRLDRGEI